MPRYVVLADGDNELLVDFENKMSVQAFIAAIKNREAIVLKEFSFPENKMVKNEKGDFFINQFIAPLIKTEKVYTSGNTTLNKNTSVIQSFSPGSEWVYYKLYCGIKSADKILQELIQPVVLKLLQEKKIDKWFFIRYNDPDFHLRIRFHATDNKDATHIISVFSQAIDNFTKQNIIWKVQLDTYQRELDRYTPQAIHLAESLFFKDSMQKLYFLEDTQGDERESVRWLWGMKSIDQLLNAFNYSLQDKHVLIKKIKEAFAKEFNADKNLFQQLNKKYSLHKAEIKNTFNDSFSPMPFTILFDDEYKETVQQIIALVNHNKINEVLTSFIHMNLNRLFLSEARLQEMVIYDFMFKYYHAQMMQSNNPPKPQ
jgi:thiopeptide-type bacteriocin biosynthesis protein